MMDQRRYCPTKGVLAFFLVFVSVFLLGGSGFCAENSKRAIRRPSAHHGSPSPEDQTIPPIKLGKGFELVPQIGHSLGIEALSVDKQGRILVSGSKDGTIKIWHIKTGALIREIKSRYPVTAVAVDPSGKVVYAGNYANNSIQCLDMKTGACLKTFTTDSGTTYNLAMDVSARLLMAGTSTGQIVFLDINGGHIVKVFGAGKIYNISFQIYAAAEAPTGTYLAANGTGGEVLIWDMASGRLAHRIKAHHPFVTSVAFDPSGHYLVTGGVDGLVKVWNVNTGRLIRSQKGHGHSVVQVAVAARQKAIISTDDNGGIRLWDLKTGQLLKAVHGHTAGIDALVESPVTGSFMTGAKDCRINMWNASDGRLMRTFAPPGMATYAVDVDPSETVIASGGTDRTIRIWDLNSGLLRHSLKGHQGAINDLVITHDGECIISASEDKTLRIWDLKTGRMLKTLKGTDSAVRVLALHPGGKTFASGSADGNLAVWDLATGKRLRSTIDSIGGISALAFDPQGRLLMAGNRNGIIRFHDCRTGKVQFRTEKGSPLGLNGVKGHAGPILSMACDPKGRYVMASSSEGRVIFWSMDTGKFIHGIIWNDIGLSIIPDLNGERIIAGSLDGSIKIWDIRYEDIVQSLKPVNASDQLLSDVMTLFNYGGTKTSGINDLKLISGGRRVVAADQNGTLVLWDRDKNEHFRLMAGGDQWLMFTPDGYFDGSPHGGDLLYIAQGLDVYRVDQFALRCNRPDLILSRMGLGSDTLIQHFRGQFFKRLKRAGLSISNLVTSARPPESKIISARQQGKSVWLDLMFRDRSFPLSHYNIYINDVPKYGSYGKALNGKKARLEESVELTSGNNKIEVSCLNTNGVESFRDLVFKDYKKTTPADLYFIGFGVSRYKDSRLNLSYAHKDVLDLSRLLSGMEYTFNQIHVAAFTNEQATIHAVNQAGQMLKKARVDDTVILFIAGHGVHDAANDDAYYFLTHEADLDHLPGTAARFETIEHILQGIAPRKKLFFMDTCESGEKDDNDSAIHIAASGSRGIVPRTARAITLRKTHSGTPHVTYKDRYIYNDLIRRSGAVVFSSSKGNEFSYESAYYKNGLFTQALIDAFTSGKADSNHDKVISSHELRRYVKKLVSAMSKGLQTPTVDRDNLYQPIPLPLVRPPRKQP